MKKAVEFSLVIPTYNQEENLKKNLPILIRYLNSLRIRYEILIAEDGSRDGSYKVAKLFSKRYKEVRLIHSNKRLGRGRALKNAFRLAKGKYVGYIDADNATKIKYIDDLIEYVKFYDVVTGSRYMKKSLIKRSVVRLVASLVFNMLIKILFNSKLNDHQCGFKAFRREVINLINRYSCENHWFWDTEVLILAQKFGFSVKEFPVTWSENPRSTVKILRDVIVMLCGMFRLKMRMYRGILK